MNVVAKIDWVRFTGEGEQDYTGSIVAKVNGIGCVYDIATDDDTADCLLMCRGDGPSTVRFFGGRFKGPHAYVLCLQLITFCVTTELADNF